MTTMTMQYTPNVPRISLKKVVGLIILLAVVLSTHAVIRHGIEAEQIRKCLDKNGTYIVFQNIYDKDTFYKICRMDNGKFGLQAVIKTAKGVFEKTAFIRGTGTWQELVDYMKNIATRYTLPIE